MERYILFINGLTAGRFRAKDEDDARKYMKSIQVKNVFAIAVNDAYRPSSLGGHKANYIYPEED